MAAKTCKHGLGWVVALPSGIVVYTRKGSVVSADRDLTLDERRAIERGLEARPAQKVSLPPSVCKAALRVAFDEDEDDAESLGSNDSWSDDSDFD